MEISAHTGMVRGGRGLAVGSSLPLLCKPNKKGVYLLVYEEILLTSERDRRFIFLQVSLSSVNCGIVCSPSQR